MIFGEFVRSQTQIRINQQRKDFDSTVIQLININIF